MHVVVIVFCSAARVESVCHAGFQRVSVFEDTLVSPSLIPPLIHVHTCVFVSMCNRQITPIGTCNTHPPVIHKPLGFTPELVKCIT